MKQHFNSKAWAVASRSQSASNAAGGVSYLGSLIVLEYPRFRGTNILQSPLKLPREASVRIARSCQGVMEWTASPRCPRHCVTRRRLHVESLSYSTAGTGILVYASLIHTLVLRAAIFACVILLSDMRVACAAFHRGVKLLRCEVFH